MPEVKSTCRTAAVGVIPRGSAIKTSGALFFSRPPCPVDRASLTNDESAHSSPVDRAVELVRELPDSRRSSKPCASTFRMRHRASDGVAQI